MKRHLTAAVSVLVVAALVLPGAALAAGNGKGSEKSRGERPAAAQKDNKADAAARKAQKDERKQAREAQKTERKQVRSAAKVERKQNQAGLAEDPQDNGSEPTVDGSSTPWPERPVDRAFASITTNLERSVAKVEAGKKSQLPPGLVRVWLKFASWLGVDPTLMPTIPVAPPVDPTGEPTSTVEPTGTVEPTSTVEPTGTVEPDPLDPVLPPVDETGMPVE